MTTSAKTGALVLLATIALAGAAPAAAAAQEQAEAGGTTGRFLYAYPTTLEFIADRGFTEETTEQVFLFVPTVLSAGINGRQTRLYAVYEPEIEVLSGHGEINSVNHAAAVTLSHELARTLVFNAGASLLRTNDPARRIPDTVVVLPSGNILETGGYAGITWQMGRFTSLELRADHAVADIDAAEAFGTLAVDHQGTAGTIALSRVVGRDKVIGVSYSLLEPRLIADDALKNDPDLLWVPPGETQHSLNLTYAFAAGPTTTIEMQVGAVQIDDTYLSAAAELQKQGRSFFLKARYGRLAGQFAGFLDRETVEGQIPIPLPPGMLLKIISHLLTVDLNGNLTDTIELHHRLRASQSDFIGIDLDSFTLSAEAKVAFRTNDTVSPYVGFQYLGDGLSAGMRRRFVAGINLNFFGPSGAAARRQEWSRRNAALPYGR
jgi:opacity protein-like surface antigen